MAPEQLRGEPADARSDQFSFCVVLFEALFGERPYDADEMTTLLAAIERGPPPCPRGRIDRAREGALGRGLAADQRARFARMADLLGALERDRAGSSVRWLLGLVGAVVLLVAAATLAARGWSETPPCADAGAAIGEVWSPVVGDAIAASFSASGAPSAQASSSWAVPRLDDYARRWAEGQTAACTATLVDRLQTPESMELRFACLRRAKHRFAVVVEALAHADRTTVENVASIIGELAPLDRCDDVDRLRTGATFSPPADLAAEVEQARDALARAELLRSQGRVAEAYDALVALHREANAIGFEPLAVEVAVIEGAMLVQLDRRRDAEPVLRTAIADAIRLGAPEQAVVGLESLVRALEETPSRRAEVEWLTTLALSIAVHDDPGGPLEADALTSRARAEYTFGRPREAVELQRRALAIVSTRADDELALALHLGRLGTMLVRMEKVSEGLAALQDAIEIQERLGTPAYFQLGLRNTLSTAMTTMGRHEEAEAIKRWGLATATAALGARHRDVAAAATRLGTALARQGRLDAATGWFLAALAIYDVSDSTPEFHPYLGLSQVLAERGDLDGSWLWAQRAHEFVLAAHGPVHPDTASVVGMLAAISAFREPELAEARALDYVATTERVFGPEHVETAHAWLGLADIRLQTQGVTPEVEAGYRQALPILEQELPSDHMQLAFVRQGLADCVRARGQYAEARTLLEQAWAVRSESDTSPSEQGITAQALAEVLWELPSERARALHLAHAAVDAFARMDTPEARMLGRQTKGWLAARERPAPPP
jgi:tetratricopeptide (TPR) repeat protein